MDPKKLGALVQVEKEVHRATGVHRQKYWVHPEEADELARLGKARRISAEESGAAPTVEATATAQSLLQDAASLTDALDAARSAAEMDMPLIHPDTHEEIPPKEVVAILESWQPQELPEGERVIVHHATNIDTAKQMLREGVIPQLKPMTLARREYEAGGEATFAPGKGLSGGIYVAEPGAAEGYGRVILEIEVPKSFLEVSPEQSTLGVSDPGESLRTVDGAVISQPIPPSAIRRIR